MTTYKEITRLTGNNKGYAAMAVQTLIETSPWVTGNEAMVYLRNADNDWVAIPDYYTNEISNDIQNGPMFTSVSGITVILGADANANYIAVIAE